MKYVISRYNHDLTWLMDYTDDFIIYDRSEAHLEGSIVVQNIGSDIYDKFSFIIDNYDSLPDVAVYAKANLFKYISKEEFDKVKDNKTFTPLFTRNHPVDGDKALYYNDMYTEGGMIFYQKGGDIFWGEHKFRYNPLEIMNLMKVPPYTPLQFAPGSNYILPKEHILKQPKELYEKLRSYLDYAVYPPEAWVIERGLYTIWK